MYAIGCALLRGPCAPTFQQGKEASEIGENHVGSSEASRSLRFRPCRDASQDQNSQASESSGSSDIGIQAVTHANEVSGANAPGVGDEFQSCCLRLTNNER